jgi:hypothetical protein
MTSFVCGKNVISDFCADPMGWDCSGNSKTSGTGPSASPSVWPNDVLTTFWGGCKDPSRKPAMVFADTDCMGESIRIDYNPDNSYMSMDDVFWAGLQDNKASAVMVP